MGWVSGLKRQQCRARLMCQGRRCLSSVIEVFDRSLKKKQKDKADRTGYFDYLRDEVARRIVGRIQDVKREFPVCIDIGCGHGHIAKHLSLQGGSVKNLVQVDSSLQTVLYNQRTQSKHNADLRLHNICADEEFIPFQAGSADLVVSSLSLNWVNDLVSCLTQIRTILKPDGAFIAAFLGGDTLQELRSAFAVADLERSGGLSPHISPMVSSQDAGSLLQESGFVIPTVDNDRITCMYPDMFTLMEHLTAMGECNVSLGRRPFVSRDIFLAAAAAYEAMYANEDGLIPATFNIIYMIGWSPDPEHQHQPLKRGSAKASLRDI
uniref:Methyltransferase type 11 domain-containing protein n=1 Tax=Spongospora subterranea TaxID=70186 RepID=A0A0H5QTG6_9EUKA|eukprot:CRZ04851.1 hypothetical protein [Spongospora subterranea]